MQKYYSYLQKALPIKFQKTIEVAKLKLEGVIESTQDQGL